MDKVKTISGELIDANLCRRIKDKYYKIGDINIEDSGDCYFVSGKYTRVETGTLFYDYAQGKYRRRSELVEPMENVLVDIIPISEFELTKEQKKMQLFDYAFKFRLAEKDIYNMVHIDLSQSDAELIDEKFKVNQSSIIALNEEIARKMKYVRSKNIDAFVPKGADSSSISRGKIEKYQQSNFDLNIYGAEGNKGFNIVNTSYKKYSKNINPDNNSKKLAELLGNYMFGCELESSGGYIPANDLFKYGCLPVRDGSINGHEFVTVPYKGAVGVQAFKEILNKANKHLLVDETCSLHYHISGLSNDPKYVVALYMLASKIQQEVFEMLPPFKKDPRFFAQKRNHMDHCKFIPELGLFDRKRNLSKSQDNLMQAFITIVTWFNDGAALGNYNFNKDGIIVHSKEGHNKWDFQSRYHWINFIPWLFKKQKTVEFRAHHGTSNPTKSIMWLFICVSILNFVKKYYSNILNREKFNLEDIITSSVANENMQNLILGYINTCKDESYKNKAVGEMYGSCFKNDKDFKFVKDKKDVFSLV